MSAVNWAARRLGRASMSSRGQRPLCRRCAVRAFGAVHIAVNCAGVADAAKTVSKGEPFPLATWNKVLRITTSPAPSTSSASRRWR